MIGVSTDYRQQLIAGNRNWVIEIPVFLSGNTGSTPDFTLTNEHIWDNGIVLDEAISSDNSFDIGAAIVGSLKVVIDNITGNFSQYDFYGAKLTIWLGVEGDEDNGTQRLYRMGFFVVDTPSYNGSLITLNCLDNMTWFDVPFDSVTGITYPANAGTVVQKICQTVGVTLGTPTFPNYANTHTRILAKPEQQLNCREVLQYIAQMCCCYCKINTAGQLVLKWHDKSAIIGLHDYDGGTFSTHTTPYSDGDAVDGMLFNPWNQGTQFDGGTFEQLRDRAYISQNYDCEVSTDDVVVTGCRVRNNTTKDENKAYDELWVDPSVEATHPRYVLIIENNPFITKAKAANIANIVGNTLAGLPTRGFTATSLADFSYETGDMATVVDFRGNRYYTWITHFTFTTNNSERFSCGVESIRKRSEQRYSGAVKTLAEANQNAEDALSAYDTAVKALNDLGNNAIDFTEYVYPVGAVLGQSRTVYRYNGGSRTGTNANPKFPNSTAVFKITGDGVFVALAANGDIAADGTCTFSNGYDANSGTAILNTLYAKGISCNSIRSGRLSLGGSDNSIYKNGELYMYNDNNDETGHWTRDGISVKTGTITLGGKGAINDNKDGVYIGSDGIELGKGKFKVTDAGQLTAKSGYIGNGSSGWTIANTAIYNGINSISGTAKGTYVGVDGIRNNKDGDTTKYTKITNGNLETTDINAKGGYIGNGSNGWTIQNTSIYNGCNAINSNTNGTYVGTNGIRNVSGSNKSYITDGGIYANHGEIGGFTITSDHIGDEIGSTNCVGMKKQEKLFTYSPDARVDIGIGEIYVATGSDTHGIRVYASDDYDGEYVQYGYYDIYSSYRDDVVAWSDDVSDSRLKKNIKNISSSAIRRFFEIIKPSTFKFKKEAKEDDKNHFGVIAQNLEEALDKANLPKDAIIDIRERDGIYRVNYRELHGMELKGIKDLYEIVNNQQSEIDLLKQEVAELKARLK